jgi:glycosyltransferase involved in cell wall biosynthesis
MNSNTNPLISVLIPVYNGENYLRESIDSVLTQTLKDFELLVIDDGSKDSTWNIIESYGNQLKGFRKENGGVASALNLGIQKARGQWIAWLSHDDLFLPNKLERQIKFLDNNPKYRACYTSYYVIDEHGNPIRQRNVPNYPNEQILRTLFGVCYINGSSMLIHRSCFDKIGLFNTDLRLTQDIEFWFRLASEIQLGSLNEPLIMWRWHPDQDSVNLIAQKAEEQKMYDQVFHQLGIEKIFPELKSLASDPKTISWGYEWFGDTMLQHHGWYLFAIDQYQKSIEHWPSWRNRARLKQAALKAQLSGSKERIELAELLVMRGRNFAGLGKMKEARTSFANAIRIQPSRIDAYQNWLLMCMGKDIFYNISKLHKKILYRTKVF